MAGSFPVQHGVPRDRHGRGMRGPLLPPHVPGFRSRADQFDTAVIEVVAELEPRWPEQLAQIEFAVDDVPAVTPGVFLTDSDAIVDAEVPLTRFHAPGVDSRGRATKARIVVYRRPMEMRCPNRTALMQLMSEVIADQLVAVLGEGNV